MKWTVEENEFLKCNRANMTLDDLAQRLGRTVKAVKNKCYRMGLVVKEDRWTPIEIQLLKKTYEAAGENGVLNLAELSKLLNRDKANVCRKAKEIGLITNKNRSVVENKKVIKPKFTTTEERNKANSENAKRWIKNQGHPRGMKGKHHSPEYCKQISKRMIKSWADMTPEDLEKRRIKQINTRIKNGTLNASMNRENPYSRANGGKREDLNNTYFRSSWEANMARYFNFAKIEWEYEPKCFIFPNIRRGNVSYTPDFYLPETDTWIEVKGWMDTKSITKLKRFEKNFPEEFKKLEIIGPNEYKEFAKWKRLISGWE